MTKNEADHSDAVLRPEELVRRETKAVDFLRALLIVVLIIVGASLSFGSYKLERKWEEKTYQREFESIASQLTNGFRNAVSQAMWNGHLIGAAISASSDLVNAAPNITIPNFEKLVDGAVQASRIEAIFWSPLVNGGEKQRREWEAFAQQEMELGAASPPKPCPACGDQNLTVGARFKEVVLPIGTYSCIDLDYAGHTGVVTHDSSLCPILVSYTTANCECRPFTPQELHNATIAGVQSAANFTPRLNTIFQTSNHQGDGVEAIPVQGPGPYSPLWQLYPAAYFHTYGMYDLLSDKYSRGALKAMIYTRKTIFSVIDTFHTLVTSPVIDQRGEGNGRIIGSVDLHIEWSSFLQGAVPLGSKGLHIVLENSCGQQRTFQSSGVNVVFIGSDDLHESDFSSVMRQTSFDDFFTSQTTASPYNNDKKSRLNCGYRISVYSSSEFRSNYISQKPVLYATVVCLIFVFTGIVFVIYDCYVARRQRKVMNAVLRRDEIVSSLFPAAVRERMFRTQRVTRRSSISTLVNFLPKVGLPSVTRNRSVVTLPETEPIADFFPLVTIVFADISGFTAWSSEREPSQVFQLLETVYQAFDKIAQKYDVFKIETIGDCYVAVAGIPVFQPDHAVRIVKFAYECLIHMHELTHELESILGPGTSSLSIRVGVHSGPVIAGVLRGEKCRFQLFGDTVNTTARMQTTGENNKIQISKATAGLLDEADMSRWIQARDVAVSVKGKGLTQTYWVDPHTQENDGSELDRESEESAPGRSSNGWGGTRLLHPLCAVSSTEDKVRRLVEWNSDLLWRLLNKIVAARKVYRRRSSQCGSSFNPTRSNLKCSSATPFEDVTEIVPMPDFSERGANGDAQLSAVALSDIAKCQLKEYVAAIASMYHDNPFHNFEHASHVALSASKVVMRIIMPDVEHSQESLTNRKGRLVFKRKIHNSTFGISSDVLMQFAVVFSAIIHDVDHLGVSNAQLIKEGHEVAVRYDSKCVAEQNSVDIAWDLLMKPQYSELVQSICPTEDDRQRFRQLLINAVLATDIADRELQQKRKNRWDKAFHCGSGSTTESSDSKVDVDRKATIVFEYIIQASDVAHTMQHWKVYTQWNERLFEERYKAFLCGREEKDPSIGWYNGEIWFFDNYIIPLAKKLETCGVFGVSSDEYLSYALENRHEWELKGEEIVSGLIQKYSPTDGQER